VQAPASKSKTQQKAEGNAGSFSLNSVPAASPRSNPATAFAEFSPRANDAGSASAGKNIVSSDASPFQRLDSGEAPATLLHSSAHQIAVGVHDPALGWLEVQTQSSAGHISATLTAASTDAHANLTAEMPAITQYLADRNVPLHSLNVDTQGSAAGGGQSQQSGSGQPQQELARQSGHVSQSGAQPLRGTAQDVSTTETVSASRISVRA
jgi:flagellar hook-length control protein FliK